MKAATKNAADWFDTFEKIPIERCENLLAQGEYVLNEITPEKLGDKVRFWGCTSIGKITFLDRNNEDYIVEFEDGEDVETLHFDVVRDTSFPNCDELYALTNVSDEKWLDDGGLYIMADLGFRIYESLDGGVKWTYVFGMDGGLNDIALGKLFLARTKMGVFTPKSA